MKKLILLTIGILAAVAVRAGNVVTFPAVTGAPGDVVDVTVSLDNDQPVSAIQLQIPVTNAITVVSGSETLCQRAASHSATVGIKDGVLNIMVYALNMAPISGNSGEVLSFKVHLGDIPTIVPLQCTKLTLTDVEGNPVDGTVTDGSIAILAPKARLGANSIDFGHVPIRSAYHKAISVSNIGTAPLVITGIDPSASEFSSTTAFPLTIEGGQSSNVDITYAPTERGAIDESVRLLSNNIDGNNTVRLLADPFAVNELHVMDATGYADSTVTIHLKVNNMDAISGFQFEFDLPKQLQYVDGSFKLTERSNGHALTVTHKDGKLVAIAYSVLDKTFKGEDGEIATFDVIISGRNSFYLKATKAILTANYKGKDMNVTSNDYRGYIRIYSPTISAVTTLNMGATPVTTVATKSISVRNNGSAPLIIDRVTFDTEGFSVSNSFPLTIANSKTINLNIEYNGISEGDFKGVMNIYSNDPDNRMHDVTITGSRFAPNYMEFTATDVLNDNDLLVDFALDTYDAMDGMQFDITYPAEWFEPNGEYVMTERAPGFVVTERVIEPGVIRCFLYSLGSSNIQAGTGKIGTIKFSTKEDTPAGTYTLNISNIKLGTSELNDKYAGQNLSCSFNVKHLIYVSAIELDTTAITMRPGETVTLIATVSPEDATYKDVEWTSSDNEVATVSQDGVVTALKTGTATITAKTTDGSELSASCEVKVVLLGDVNLDGNVDIADVNSIVNIILTRVPANAFDRRDDINGNGVTDIADVNACVNIILKR